MTEDTTLTHAVTRRGAVLGGLGALGGLGLSASLTMPAQALTPARLALPVNPAVLHLGDSYSEGVGAVPTTKGFAYQIAAPLGWKLTLDAKGGSGYLNPTTYGSYTYATRLAKHTADGYDLVVIQGGSNDEKTVTTSGVTTPVYSDAALVEAINATLDLVKSRYPRAKVLLMGPTNPYGGASTRMNNLLLAATGTRAIPYLNPIAEKWFMPGDGAVFANPDNGHPSNAGHAHLRSLFVRDVQVLA